MNFYTRPKHHGLLWDGRKCLKPLFRLEVIGRISRRKGISVAFLVSFFVGLFVVSSFVLSV